MNSLIVTGGIATGKTTFLCHLVQLFPAIAVFDCDRETHRLLTEPEVIDRVKEIFGSVVLNADGTLNRSRLGSLVFSDGSRRIALENLLHPLIAEKCALERVYYHAQNPTGLFVADVPLYFEANSRFEAQRIIVVALTPKTQLRRLILRAGITESEARLRINAQLSIYEKMKRADVVIWNEGNSYLLQEQAAILCNFLL